MPIGYGPAEIRQVTRMSEQRTTAAGGMETSYGYRRVGAGDKQSLVNDVFHRVANRYDLMNDLMSGGLHRLWKAAMVAGLKPPQRAGWKVLDVAGGTGDIAFRIIDASGGQAHATVLDINGSMLAVGRERAEKRGLAAGTDFVEANAEELPFADETFDAYTIAFGIRNVPRIEVALAEAYRVLKPGGRFLCLEFSEVDMPVLDQGRTAAGIDIGDHVWLGAHVVVTDGSTVGRDAIVGAGAIVVGAIPEFAIAVGTPAKVLRDRRETPNVEP